MYCLSFIHNDEFVFQVNEIHFIVVLCIGALPGNGNYYSYDLPVSILDLNCTGNESMILDCPYNGTVSFFNCPSSHDAEVICRSK